MSQHNSFRIRHGRPQVFGLTTFPPGPIEIIGSHYSTLKGATQYPAKIGDMKDGKYSEVCITLDGKAYGIDHGTRYRIGHLVKE